LDTPIIKTASRDKVINIFYKIAEGSGKFFDLHQDSPEKSNN
jgi:hypothetical protein